MRYADLLSNSIAKFPDKDKALDVQILLETAFNLTRTQFWIKKDDPITDRTALRRFYRYRSRLLNNEPVAYILKEKEFYGRTFYVDKRVLVPRPETERLVETAIHYLPTPGRILDIGAGSGVIGIMLALETGSSVTAVDISTRALAVVKKNITRHHVEDRVFPMRADLFPPHSEPFDMIVSNPPYIPEQEWRELDATVRDHEPKKALASGDDGLTAIRGIVSGAKDHLKPGGRLIMEMGYNQSERVRKLLETAGFTDIEIIDDYGGIPRIAAARTPERKK